MTRAMRLVVELNDISIELETFAAETAMALSSSDSVMFDHKIMAKHSAKDTFKFLTKRGIVFPYFYFRFQSNKRTNLVILSKKMLKNEN